MRSNGHGEAPGLGVVRTADALSHVRWQTGEAIALPRGAVWASGDASVQVRSPQRLAAVGDLVGQLAHIQQIIVEALAAALAHLEPALEDLPSQQDELASLTLVAANTRLAAVGVVLLELQIDALIDGLPSP